MSLIASLVPFTARAEVITTTLGETVETPEANLSVDIKANRSEARRGEKITYTVTIANASQDKTITTDLSLIFFNLDLNVSSIQPKKFTGRSSNLTGYPWNFFFKLFQLKPLEKKVLTFTATVNAKAKTNERLRMAAAIQEGEFRNTELIQVDTVYVTASDGPARSEQKVQAKDIPVLFMIVYGRAPTGAEKKYWVGRMKDKATKYALKGAMVFQKSRGKSPKVLGVTSNKLLKMEFNDNVTESAAGERVTYSLTIHNRDDQGRALTPGITVTAKNLEIPFVSDHGKRILLSNRQYGGSIYWGKTQILNQAAHTFTFHVKTPSAVGSEYCLKAEVFAQPDLRDEDCNVVVKAKPKKIAPKKAATAKKPTATTPAITSDDFSVKGPDTLDTDPDDQEIKWHRSDAIERAYPTVKIELCPSKEFKDCIVLHALAENDGSQLINMPPVPRVGKWYLHLIGRDSQDRLRPHISASRRIEL